MNHNNIKINFIRQIFRSECRTFRSVEICLMFMFVGAVIFLVLSSRLEAKRNKNMDAPSVFGYILSYPRLINQIAKQNF